MIRALVTCALVIAVGPVAAQNASPPSVPELAPISACGKHNCPSAAANTTAEAEPDKHALLRQKLAEMNCLQSEIDALRVATGTPQQVLVKVKVVEVSRTKLDQLGIDLAALHGEGQTTQAQPSPSPTPGKQPAVELGVVNDGSSVLGLIKRLEDNNVAKVLAEPNIIVTCGRPGQFNVGGEVPMPTPLGSRDAVEYKSFGTQVDVLAIAQGDDRVRLELRARVSELDHGQQIEIAGVRVPGFQVRQIDTGLDLKFGQTGVVSGMMQRRVEQQKRDNKVVNVVHDIELLFLVTPEAAVAVAPPNPTESVAEYRTATSDSDVRPNERSVRVTKPYTPR